MVNKIAISLGNVCTSAQYGLKKDLRPPKKDGYKTCPFDLMTSNVGGVIDCIKPDFKYFCDPSLLKIKELGHEDGEDRFMINHKKYNGFGFNHEAFNTGERYLYKREDWPGGAYHFVNDNFKYLVERYEKRASNFRFYCESDYYVTFILQFYNDEYSDELMNRLHDAIKNRFPKLEYEIKVIESSWKPTGEKYG